METGHCGWFASDVVGLRVSGSSLSLADCWRVSGEVKRESRGGLWRRGTLAEMVLQSAAGGGERRGREWSESSGFAPQRLVCQWKYISRKVFVQSRPGKEGGHGSGGAGGITTQ